MITVKYILLTICNRAVRVAIGIQPNHTPLVYWMGKENHCPVDVELGDRLSFEYLISSFEIDNLTGVSKWT